MYLIEKDNTLLNYAFFVYNSMTIAVSLSLSKLAGKFAQLMIRSLNKMQLHVSSRHNLSCPLLQYGNSIIYVTADRTARVNETLIAFE